MQEFPKVHTLNAHSNLQQADFTYMSAETPSGVPLRLTTQHVKCRSMA